MVLSAKRRRYIGSIKERYILPSTYKRVSWAGSKGNERVIDTGMYLKDVGCIEMLANHWTWGNYGDNWLLGVNNNSSKTGFYYPGAMNASGYAIWEGVTSANKAPGHQMSLYRLKITGANSVEWQMGINSGTLTVNNVASANPNAEIKMMCNSYMGNSAVLTGIKIYSLKLYGRKPDGTNSGELISYMVPAKRIEDSKIGMYDFIRHGFYYGTDNYNNKSALYKGATFSDSSVDKTANADEYWGYHQIGDGQYYGESTDYGKSTNVHFIAEPGTISFTNPTQDCKFKFFLLDYKGKCTHSKTVLPGESISWKITKRMAIKSPHIGFVWWKEGATLTETQVRNINWSFTYN